MFVVTLFLANTGNRSPPAYAGLAVKVERNSFNLYRCFLAMYGPDTGPEELRKYIAEAEHRYSTALPQGGRVIGTEVAETERTAQTTQLRKRRSARRQLGAAASCGRISVARMNLKRRCKTLASSTGLVVKDREAFRMVASRGKIAQEVEPVSWASVGVPGCRSAQSPRLSHEKGHHGQKQPEGEPRRRD